MLAQRAKQQATRRHRTNGRANEGRKEVGVDLWSDGSRDFPPLDARLRETGRNGWGRRVTAEAVGRPFAHVTSDNRDQMGIGRDPRGEGGATCKIAGIAYTGSNPVPATTALASDNVISLAGAN